MNTRIVIILVSIGLISPTGVYAAALSFDTPKTVLAPGEVVAVALLLDPQGEVINAIEGTVLASGNIAIAGVREDNTIVPVWVERPMIARSRALSFSGIIPGGFSGVVSPFWDGERPGTVLTVLIEATGPGTGRLTLAPDARVLAHDGKGTAQVVTARDALLTVTDTPRQETLIPEDTTAPDEFTATIGRDPSIFNGNAFVAFATVDRQSGVDRYEVAEGATADANGLAFVRTESPHQLSDQSLRSYIFVKAIDRAGNERLSVLAPEKPVGNIRAILSVLLAVLLALLLALFAHKFIKAP